ncbi:hypothetical protein M7I_6280 [Glarea lozoyensis 74030]|uniref:Uncharacterized protein n=1 Tax=Glarea lozoyensis (strain ATCC 74030 / MF5533) TaxID=1104152 RepID=H0EU51_GLAL7|nr:hypothetical protein M7I_6280 [Glarea lozoyensis 74030]
MISQAVLGRPSLRTSATVDMIEWFRGGVVVLRLTNEEALSSNCECPAEPFGVRHFVPFETIAYHHEPGTIRGPVHCFDSEQLDFIDLSFY